MPADELPLHYTNLDLHNIVTPVDRFVTLLYQSGYDQTEIKFLEQGFKYGFDIGYSGPTNRRSEAKYLPLRVGSKTILWNKIMKEVNLGRVAGPFKDPPFQNYIQSPIGLVPKKGKDQTRLIFHLSYEFPDVHLCLQLKGDSMGPMYMGKTDAQSAFRILPLSRSSWKWVLMRAQDPETGNWMYFVNKCLPFESSISCSHFQWVSDALKHLIEFVPSALVWYQTT